MKFRLCVCTSVRLQWPARGLIAGTLIWYWHEAPPQAGFQCIFSTSWSNFMKKELRFFTINSSWSNLMKMVLKRY